MPTKIQRWRNGQGVRIPQAVPAETRMQVRDTLDTRAVDGSLVVTLAFRPAAGHEHHGRRHALVISNDLSNRATGFSLVCPIARTERAKPLHVPIPPGTRVTGSCPRIDSGRSTRAR